MRGDAASGRVVLVTGAASGIGAAAVRAFEASGDRVWTADLYEGPTVGNAIPLDVTNPSDWAAAFARLHLEAGGLDVLVNAAGISRTLAPAGILEADLEGWQRVFAVNVQGVLLGCQSAVALMGVRGGAIVNISSTTALSPTPTLGAYGATKAAVLQLTMSIAAACAMNGWPIRCNAVLPGMTETPMVAGMAPASRAAWEAQIPSGRFADTQEIANAIVFLASGGASYINGTGLAVDGGLLARPVVR